MMKKIASVSGLLILSMGAESATDSSSSMGGLMLSSLLTPTPVLAPEQSRPTIQLTNPVQNIIKNRMFGAQLFSGAFANTTGSVFNDDYILNTGDNVQIRLWGAYDFSGTLTVDAQGNIFIPNVGPVRLAGVKNIQLQSTIEQQVRRFYRSNVSVYAGLERAQPVKVYVTGSVTQPGSYGGVSNDSVLAYLDRAGGVDSERGSYIGIQIHRNGKIMQSVNLYDFLLDGDLQPFSFKNGDIVIVSPRKSIFEVEGEVYNSYIFEFDKPNLTINDALNVAKIRAGATHISVFRKQGNESTSEYYPISQAGGVLIQNGDRLKVVSDRFAGTIQIRIEGAHAGEHALVLPYGSTLAQVLSKIKVNELSEVDALQLYRKSVAIRQKQMLTLSLNKLEESTYSVRSATNEEASLRVKDAELIQKFIDRARQIEPDGQVIFKQSQASDMILEDGDILKIPERTSVIMVHGEVLFPNALAWIPHTKAIQYINQVGGYTQSSDKSKIIVLHQNGEADVAEAKTVIQQGDQVLVLPKVDTKRVEISRGISQVVYQIAVAAKVVFGL